MVAIGEQVPVIAAFSSSRKLRPLRFRWSGKRVDIKEVTYTWTTLEGNSKLFHFSVTDGNTLFQLSFDTNSVIWKLEGVETEV